MTDPHAPTPEFLAHLERETRFAVRRADHRVAGPRAGLWGRLRAAALVTLSLGAGAGVVLAAEHVQDARRVERALARNQVLVELATRRVTAVRELAERARIGHGAGMIDAATADDAARRLVTAERALRHMTLEREALALGGEPLPRAGGMLGGEVSLDLSAPLFGVRDFVSEHLRIDRDVCADAVERAQREAKRAAQLAQQGMVPILDVGVAELALADAERALVDVDRRLALRAEFVLGRVSREECVRQDLLAAAESRRAAGEARLGHLRRTLGYAEQLHKAGVAPAPNALRLELAEVEADLALTAFELDALR